MVFDYIKRVLSGRRESKKRDNPKAVASFTTGSASTLYIGSPGLSQIQSQPVVTFSSSKWSLPQRNDALNQLVDRLANHIDEKRMSDYEFREWLRDNLSGCEYQSTNGLCKYVRADDTKPISVIDTIMEIN